MSQLTHSYRSSGEIILREAMNCKGCIYTDKRQQEVFKIVTVAHISDQSEHSYLVIVCWRSMDKAILPRVVPLQTTTKKMTVHMSPIAVVDYLAPKSKRYTWARGTMIDQKCTNPNQHLTADSFTLYIFLLFLL